MSRAIEESFLEDLQRGQLKVLLDEVHNDDTLCLELRGKYVKIYYRGGVLYSICKENSTYKISFNMDYCSGKQNSHVIKNPNVEDAVKYLPYYKQTMDYHIASAKNNLEKEFQQLILRENNNTKSISVASDYFILDMEYTESENEGRCDLIALEWKSTGSERQKKSNRKLAFIEVKYGDGAMSNLTKHIKDFVDFIQDREKIENLAKEMEKVFLQKCRLELIKGYHGKDANINISRDTPELILLFANHDPDSSILKRELLGALEKYPEHVEQIRIARASGMGYGLYAYNNSEQRFPNIREYCGAI